MKIWDILLYSYKIQSRLFTDRILAAFVAGGAKVGVGLERLQVRDQRVDVDVDANVGVGLAVARRDLFSADPRRHEHEQDLERQHVFEVEKTNSI